MAKPKTRTWDETTPLALAVDFVDGLKWAAAITDLSVEGLIGALTKGRLHHGPAAVRLAKACLARGRRFSIESLVGEPEMSTDAPAPAPKGKAEKGRSRTFRPPLGGTTRF
jgi:hypothetical protein